MIVATGLAAYCADAQVIIDKSDDDKEPAKGSFVMPYYFRTDSMDDGFGLSYVGGLFQGSGSYFLAGYATANGSWGLNFAAKDHKLGSKRWQVDYAINYEDNEEQRFYGDLASPIGAPDGGSHGSPPEDFLSGPGKTIYADARLRYPLPIGDGRKHIVAEYQTDQGILAGPPSGGERWNPLESGRTELSIRPFYQLRNIQVSDANIDQFPPVLGVRPGDEAEHKTAGIEVALTYDNRDFMQNPERGSLQRFTVTHDFHWFDSTDYWTALEFEFSKYFSLGATDGFRQRVIAMNVWTAFSPSFTRELVGDFVVFTGTPPSNLGVTLGGSTRMRSYPVGRFSDKAGIYYTAELRLIPEWTPIRNWPLIRRMPLRWWQFVPFIEVGRTANHWDVAEMHSDMNVNYGFAIRTMIGGEVLRAEMVAGEETTQFWFSVDHPF